MTTGLTHLPCDFDAARSLPTAMGISVDVNADSELDVTYEQHGSWAQTVIEIADPHRSGSLRVKLPDAQMMDLFDKLRAAYLKAAAK